MSDAEGRSVREPSTLRGMLVTIAVATLATLCLAWPVIRAPDARIFGDGRVLGHDDPNRDALVVIEQFRTGAVPAPYLQPMTDLPGQWLARAWGAVPAYNLLVLSSFPLAAAAAYVLARALLHSNLAALVAGLLYAFLPFHVAQAGGHLHIAQTQWIPLYFLALYRCLDQPTVSRAFWLAASSVAVTLSSFYLGFVAAVMTPLTLTCVALTMPEKSSTQRRVHLVKTTLVLATVAATALLAGWLWLPVPLSSPDLAFDRSDLFIWSARWWSYLIPPVAHPIVGASVHDFWIARGFLENQIEHQQVSLGWSVLFLAGVAVYARASRRSTHLADWSVPALAIVAAGAVLCSLSPERRIGGLLFVRPSSFLYELAPMFRGYARFGLVVGLMVAILAGSGAAFLWRSSRGRRLAIILMSAAAFEYAPVPPWPSRDLFSTEAHRWLAVHARGARVLDCGATSGLADSLSASLAGYVLTSLDRATIDDCGGQELGSALRALGFDHAVGPRVSEAEESSAEFKSSVSDDAPRREFPDSWLVDASHESGPAYVRQWDGFSAREHQGDRSWRWMGQTGVLRLVVPSGGGDASVRLDLRAFPQARRIEWLVNGHAMGAIDVGAQWQSYELALGSLTAGQAALAFTSREPAIVARQPLGGADDRAISLAVGAIKFTRAAGKKQLRNAQ